jgi:preprotein translocase subunit SecA
MVLSDTLSIKSYLDDFTLDNEEIKKVIKERISLVGEDSFLETFRRIVLHVNDILWIEHLETMDYLRSSVNLRAYGQRDPLIEYKKEGLNLFKQMEISFKGQVVNLIKTMNSDAKESKNQNIDDIKENYIASHEEVGAFGLEKNTDMNSHIPPIERISENGQKIGRNDPCYCGSGKKFKKCHGA